MPASQEIFEDNFNDFNIDDFESDFNRARYLLQLLINCSTQDGPTDNNHFEILRSYFLKFESIKETLPEFIINNRDLNQFWSYIKNEYGTYQERRNFIRKEFNALLNHLEFNSLNPSFMLDLENELQKFDSSTLIDTWNKALKRKENDPEGALTTSYALLESLLKHLLTELDVDYSRNDSLKPLYKKFSKKLKLAPEDYEEELFKKILGSCSGIIEGLSSIRSDIGDAHGNHNKSYKPAKRHSEFAINLSATMCLFLLRTFNQKHDF